MWDGRRYDRTGQPGAAVPHRLILTCRANETSGRLFTCPLGRKTRAGNGAVDSEGGGIDNLGTFSLDTLSVVIGNFASASNNNKFGV
jgi:hypothetical protein